MQGNGEGEERKGEGKEGKEGEGRRARKGNVEGRKGSGRRKTVGLTIYLQHTYIRTT